MQYLTTRVQYRINIIFSTIFEIYIDSTLYPTKERTVHLSKFVHFRQLKTKNESFNAISSNATNAQPDPHSACAESASSFVEYSIKSFRNYQNLIINRKVYFEFRKRYNQHLVLCF